jgi:hypothetical protein
MRSSGEGRRRPLLQIYIALLVPRTPYFVWQFRHGQTVHAAISELATRLRTGRYVAKPCAIFLFLPGRKLFESPLAIDAFVPPSVLWNRLLFRFEGIHDAGGIDQRRSGIQRDGDAQRFDDFLPGRAVL